MKKGPKEAEKVMHVPETEIDYHPEANGHRDIRLFQWREGLYRGIRGNKAFFYKRLFDKGIIERLMAKGFLVDTFRTSLKVEGFDLVLQHRALPFVSYPFEWCAPMLKDAALLILDLSQELLSHGLTLTDPHAWNILFDGPRPVYVDLGSIGPARPDFRWRDNDNCFCPFLLYPLYLMSQGHGRIARWLLHDASNGVLKSDIAGIVRLPASRSMFPQKVTKWAYRRLSALARAGLPIPVQTYLAERVRGIKSVLYTPPTVPRISKQFLDKLKKEVELIHFPEVKTDWSDYYECFLPFTPSRQWEAKQETVYDLLKKLRPTSVLDIGSNRGWYSQLAAKLGSQVVALDTDDQSLHRLYYDARGKNLYILPLMMDFHYPSPIYGVSDKRMAAASQRTKSEFTLALALVHHLVFKQGASFDLIVANLADFSARWLLVEFIPAEDHYVREWWSEQFSWYTLNNFIKALQQRFSNFILFPSSPKPRVLLFCRRK